jgi:hypothetical protein
VPVTRSYFKNCCHNERHFRSERGENLRMQSWDCVWNVATPPTHTAGTTGGNARLCVVLQKHDHTIWHISWSLFLMNMHCCVSLCMQEANHTSHIHICAVLLRHCYFALDVMCARADLVCISDVQINICIPSTSASKTLLPHTVPVLPYFCNNPHIIHD